MSSQECKVLPRSKTGGRLVSTSVSLGYGFGEAHQAQSDERIQMTERCTAAWLDNFNDLLEHSTISLVWGIVTLSQTPPVGPRL